MFKPSSIFYWPFYGGASFVDPFCYLSQRAFFVEFLLIQDWGSILILLSVYTRKWKKTLSKNVYPTSTLFFNLESWFVFHVSFNFASQYWINLDVRNEIKTWFFLRFSILNQAFFLNYGSFAPVFSFIYCWVLIFALSPYYILIYMF